MTEASGDDGLFAWVEQTVGGRIARSGMVSGGNRCRAWWIEANGPDGAPLELFLRYQPYALSPAEPYSVRREAEVYAAIQDKGVPAPRMVARHPALQAILVERARGTAEYRRLKDAGEKSAIARDCVEGLARLHALDATRLDLGSLGPATTVVDHVRAEIGVWRAMYHESGRTDPLVEFGFAWLDAHLPVPPGPPVLVHGDAGPGNFMFEAGRMTALIDWELAHLGDPMEDLAWLSMRSVMEPIPDFPACIRAYEAATGQPVDRARILYHRVMVALRVVVIRHRNVSGEPWNSIVSRTLNRRLLVEAIAEASGWAMPSPPAPLQADDIPETALFDALLDNLRDVIVPRSTDPLVVAQAKGASKVLKFLRDTARFGALAHREQADDLAAALGRPVASVAAGLDALTAALRDQTMPEAAALTYFARQAARDTQLAAGALGGAATRHFPAF